MLKLNTTRRLPTAAAFLTCALLIYAADTKPSAAPSKPAPTDAELITSATAAAPAKVSAHATIVTMNADGTDASNTDPYAEKPMASNHWVKTGPHVMIVGAEPAFYDQYPKNADPDTSVPYVMWAGTPYQHLMIPVK